MRCNFQVFEYQKWAPIYKHAVSFTITHCIFPSFTLYTFDSHSVPCAHSARFYRMAMYIRHQEGTLHFHILYHALAGLLYLFQFLNLDHESALK